MNVLKCITLNTSVAFFPEPNEQSLKIGVVTKCHLNGEKDTWRIQL